MSVLGLLYTLLIGAMLSLFTILLAVAIGRNVKTGNRYRAELARRIEQLRLSGMFKALGIDVDQLLHQRPIAEIDAQLRRCAECTKKTSCDEDLAGGETPTPENYCPNYPHLTAEQRNP